jgi:hypothetical protein
MTPRGISHRLRNRRFFLCQMQGHDACPSANGETENRSQTWIRIQGWNRACVCTCGTRVRVCLEFQAAVECHLSPRQASSLLTVVHSWVLLCGVPSSWELSYQIRKTKCPVSPWMPVNSCFCCACLLSLPPLCLTEFPLELNTPLDFSPSLAGGAAQQ